MKLNPDRQFSRWALLSSALALPLSSTSPTSRQPPSTYSSTARFVSHTPSVPQEMEGTGSELPLLLLSLLLAASGASGSPSEWWLQPLLLLCLQDAACWCTAVPDALCFRAAMVQVKTSRLVLVHSKPTTGGLFWWQAMLRSCQTWCALCWHASTGVQDGDVCQGPPCLCCSLLLHAVLSRWQSTCQVQGPLQEPQVPCEQDLCRPQLLQVQSHLQEEPCPQC